jgi:hypothetical protein
MDKVYFCKATFSLPTTYLYTTVRWVAEGARDYIFIYSTMQKSAAANNRKMITERNAYDKGTV